MVNEEVRPLPYLDQGPSDAIRVEVPEEVVEQRQLLLLLGRHIHNVPAHDIAESAILLREPLVLEEREARLMEGGARLSRLRPIQKTPGAVRALYFSYPVGLFDAIGPDSDVASVAVFE